MVCCDGADSILNQSTGYYKCPSCFALENEDVYNPNVCKAENRLGIYNMFLLIISRVEFLIFSFSTIFY